jgi:hypothetical protein
MAEFDKKGTGTLSDNERKTEDWHPEQRGSGVWFDGTEFWIDAKVRQSNRGGEFLSLKFKLKDGQAPKKVMVQVTPQDLDDEIPF